MRRLLSLGVVTAALALAGPAVAANPQNAGLQVALRAFGLYSGAIDGIAGPRTVAAVRAFQRRKGLPATGLADLRTRRALGPLGKPLFGRRMLRRGRFGWDVSVLQFLLARRGLYHGALDGYFDGQTGRALRRYQHSVKLRPDGVAGRATYAAFALTRVPVARIQRAAARRYRVRAGDTLSGIAHRFGTTVAALARANGLRPSGILREGALLRIPGGRKAVRARPAATALATSPTTVREIIDRTANRYGLNPHLVRAVAWMESGFQPNVRSSAGAWGVMQIIPATWDFVERSLLGRRVPRTAEGNVRVGVLYLRHLLRQFSGDERLALAAWYQGPASVRKHGVLKVSRTFVANVLALKQRL